MDIDDPRHGTYAGYQVHRKQGEPACGPCRQVNSERTRERRSNPAYKVRERQQLVATNRALWRLVDLHREEYERIRGEELLDRRART